MKNLEAVKAKIIKAVPEIKQDAKYICSYRGSDDHGCSDKCRTLVDCRPITLEDVLIALGKTSGTLAVDGYGNFRWSVDGDRFDNGGIMPSWKLGKPLDQQSQETVDFLNEIL